MDDEPVEVVPAVPDCPQGALPFPPSPLPCPDDPDSPEPLLPLPEPEVPEPPELPPLDEPLSDPEPVPPEPDPPELLPAPCAKADVAIPIVNAATASIFIMGCFLIAPYGWLTERANDGSLTPLPAGYML